MLPKTSEQYPREALAPSTVCGLIFCYNEEHILRNTLLYYLSMGIDLVVFDNQSSDRSREIVAEVWLDHPERIRDLIIVKTQGFEWQKILEYACSYMHYHLCRYEWIILIDADAFYRSPVCGLSLLQFMHAARARGSNVLDGALYEFFPTENDDMAVASPVERMRYFDAIDRPVLRYPQHKIFLYHPSIDFYTNAGHICSREDLRVFDCRFLYLHYKWVSLEHGIRKIFVDRMPRFIERKVHARYHPQYLGLLPLREDLVMDSKNLRQFRDEEILMSLQEFHASATSAQSGRRDSNEADTRSTARSLGKSPSFWTIEKSEWIRQRPFADGLPAHYHFLMTDFCNAACIFCNQDFTSTRQVTLEMFQVILSHIPHTEGRDFTFTGGGEPLLCKDLFPIIRTVNEKYPTLPVRIKCNGLLVGIHAKELAKLRIDKLGISVHGSTRQSNNSVLRPRNQRLDVFEAIEELNRCLNENNNSMHKIFYFVASSVNIHEVPGLVRRAAEVGVQEVMVTFAKYFPAETYTSGDPPPADPNDSLFYDKETYNSVICQSKDLAASLGVFLRHEPLFNEPFQEVPCFQPWNTLVINWDGEVFPCTGGESWFRRAVKDRVYCFGNVLEQHISEFWNNESFTKIRRTLNASNDESFVPECRNCHNTCCFRGPNVKNAHILEIANLA
jgi:radical SAM protein with 4Fe4S-binding SPASM domain